MSLGIWIRDQLILAGPSGKCASDLHIERKDIAYRGGTYNSFARWFHWYKQLGYISSVTREDAFSKGGNNPLIPRHYYAITSTGASAPLQDWNDPLSTLHPGYVRRGRVPTGRPRGRPPSKESILLAEAIAEALAEEDREVVTGEELALRESIEKEKEREIAEMIKEGFIPTPAGPLALPPAKIKKPVEPISVKPKAPKEKLAKIQSMTKQQIDALIAEKQQTGKKLTLPEVRRWVFWQIRPQLIQDMADVVRNWRLTGSKFDEEEILELLIYGAKEKSKEYPLYADYKGREVGGMTLTNNKEINAIIEEAKAIDAEAKKTEI